MTDIICTYTGDRDEALVGYLYEEMDAAERAAFDAHLPTCARCRSELAALGGVRHQLARWNPPEPNLQSTINPQSAIRNPQWLRQVPVWTQVAAALLVLGVSAGAANLHVRYDSGGLSLTTGWMAPPAQTTAAVTTEPAGRLQNAATRDDLAALERQLRSEMRGQQSAQATTARTVSDADVKRLVRPLLDESEKREQRELALRIAEMLRDVSAQRQADLVNIDRNLGFIRNNTLNVDQRQRDLQNYVLRVSQQK